MSAFALKDGVVHHTYSIYDRGGRAADGDHRMLDLAPLVVTRKARVLVAPPDEYETTQKEQRDDEAPDGTQRSGKRSENKLLAEEKKITRATMSSRRCDASSRGGSREGLHLRDRDGDQVPGGALRRALTAAHLPLHVRPRLRGGLPRLLLDHDNLDPNVVHLNART